MADKKTILYAEDNENVRWSCQGLLKRLFPDVHIEVFEDGTSLEKRLKEGPAPNVVLTDKNMPGIKGSQIIVKYSPKLPGTKFIMLYGGNPNIAEYLVSKGLAYAYLLKPATTEEISGTLNMALNSSRPTESSQ